MSCAIYVNHSGVVQGGLGVSTIFFLYVGVASKGLQCPPLPRVVGLQQNNEKQIFFWVFLKYSSKWYSTCYNQDNPLKRS